MGKYEDALIEYDYIEIRETNKMSNKLGGVWLGDLVLINRNKNERDKVAHLYEELAHDRLTYGDIRDQSQFNNRKFEGYARRYAMEQLIPLKGIVDSFKHGCHNLYTIANFFEVSEGFVQDCLVHYKCRYGLSTLCGDYLIQFEPLRVFEYKTLE